MGMRDVDNMYHVPVIRSTLTRSLSVLADDIFDEIRTAFADVIPPKDGTQTLWVNRSPTF